MTGADRRSWQEALRLGAILGLPIGFVPAALFLELAPHLGFLRPAALSFGATFALFAVLARALGRSVAWLVAGAVSALLIVGAVTATAWTLTQSVTDALG